MSNIIHQIAALFYFITFQCTNNYYTVSLYIKQDHYFYLFLTINIISSIVFLAFIGCQVIIRLIEMFGEFRPTHNNFHRYLSSASFVLEAIMVSSFVVLY
jgi:hypothetical protein